MTSVQTRAADFFKAGGTLHLNAPSYVIRPADDELFRQVLAGQFCYVLTSRQRGKSSLMIRTAERLRHAGVRVAIVDLSGLGTQVTRDQWYMGMIRRLTTDLQIEIDPEAWWRARGGIGAVQRFTDFLHDVVLEQVAGSIAIFLDEIDSTLRIDFSDDFFAAIRVMFNQRASSPEYDRLTFVLLGVAAPTDLIKDSTRTPFNIGTAIALQEFSRADARPLEEGLAQRFPERGQAILDRVFYWTNGHPYLTQRLCLELAESPSGQLGDEQIDAIVERLFLAEDARKENNLQYVRSAIEAIKDRRPLMKLYRRVYEGQPVAEDKRSQPQERLRLVGLVRSDDGVLKVRNEIYRRVFDLPWIKQNTPRNLTKLVSIFAAAIVVLALIGAYLVYSDNQRRQIENNRNANRSALLDATDPAVKINYLAGLCDADAQAARALFFDDAQISQPTRLAMLGALKSGRDGDRLLTVVGCLQPNDLDRQVQNPAARAELQAALRAAICRVNQPDAVAVKQQFGADFRCGA